MGALANDPILLGVSAIALVLIISALGVPIAVSLTAVAGLGMWLSGGFNYVSVNFETLPFDSIANYSFAVIPMFVLMGAFATEAGIVTDLFTALNRFAERTRGGLYLATTAASAGFAAISGSTVVNAAVFTRMALPEMIEHGYDKRISAGLIAAAGTFAALIPPSLTFVVIGILTGESIGALFIAGIVPGLLTAAAYLVVIPVLVRFRPDWAPAPVGTSTLRERVAGLRTVWPMILLVLIVLGGIYSGLTSPTSAGAVGAAGALIIALALRRISRRQIWQSFKHTAELTSVIFFIVVGGLLFSRFLASSGFVGELISMVTQVGMSGPVFLLAIIVMYFILGMFIDSMSMLVVTLPFVFPIMISFGYNPLWFGVVVTKLMEIAVITPPFGLNLFTVVSASERRISAAEMMVGVLPFVILEIVILAILILLPVLSTWLPSTMY